MSWYLRSMGDAQTHRGAYSIVTGSVHAVCGAEFVPLRCADGVTPIELASPPDPDQVCPACKLARATR